MKEHVIFVLFCKLEFLDCTNFLKFGFVWTSEYGVKSPVFPRKVGSRDLFLSEIFPIVQNFSWRFKGLFNVFPDRIFLVGKCSESDSPPWYAPLRTTQAFESFVVRCPGQVAQFFPDIMAVCKDLLRWDPNYDYEECDDMEEDNEEDGEEDMMVFLSSVCAPERASLRDDIFPQQPSPSFPPIPIDEF